jgi:hypothetical protein
VVYHRAAADVSLVKTEVANKTRSSSGSSVAAAVPAAF